MNKLVIDEYTEEQLELARKTYGNKNQILVSMEELNELACVLAKYPRYDDPTKATSELHDRVIDEVADVMIVLDHIISIFSLSDVDIHRRVLKKVGRLERWLNNSESMQETVDDRTVEVYSTTNNMCKGCQRIANPTEDTDLGVIYDNYCRSCLQAQATEGIAPFHIGENR